MPTGKAIDPLDLVLARGSMVEAFDQIAFTRPDVDAIVAPSSPPLSFRGLFTALAAVKASLNAHGIGRGDRVVLPAPSCAATALASMATMACATLVPLNAAYRRGEFERYFERLRPRAVIVLAGDECAAREIAAMRGIPLLEIVPADVGPAGLFELRGDRVGPCPDPAWNARDDVALLLHSSGTTAQQKIIPVRGGHLLASAQHMRDSLRLGPDDRTLHVMPMFHGHGLRAALQQPLCAGSTVVCVGRLSVDRFFDELRDYRATWYSGSYTIHKAVLDHLRAHPAEAQGVHLRFIRSGSGRLDPDVMTGLERLLGTVVIERYGMSEAGTVASNPLPPLRRKAGSVGLPLGHDIVIASTSDGRPCAPGEEGEVRVRGPAVFDGYLDDPDATAAALVDGWFRTGDLGRFDADGYLVVTGRIKEMINRGGEKISPAEVEAALARHPAVRGACAFAMAHPRLGEEVGAAVVIADGATVDEDDLLVLAAETLADFKLPRRIFFLDALPLGATRKIDRRAVAGQVLAAESVPAEIGDDRAHALIRARLEPLWRHVLRRDAIPPTRDFFLLGGDSLSAAQLVAMVARVLDVEIPLRAVFREARTLARMAAMIARATPGATSRHPTLAPRPRGTRIPLSFAQEQIWIHEQLQPGTTAYSLNRIVRLRGRLDARALSRAFDVTVARHEALRTTIAVADGAPWQIVHPEMRIPLPVIAVEGANATARAARLDALIAADLQQPHDIVRGPMLRAVLHRLAADDHVLVLRVHHLVADGHAMETLTTDIAAAYLHETGVAAALPPAPALQFADFAHFDRSGYGAEQIERQLAYWRRELAGATDVDLPTDRPRPQVATATGARLLRALTRVDMQRLRLLARAEGASSFAVLLSAIQLLVHRLSGASDLVIGTPFSRRAQLGLHGVIGPLMTVLPVRAEFAGDPSFRHFLRQTTARILGTIDNQGVPLTRILDAAVIRRRPDRHPLFQVVTALLPGASWHLATPDLAAEVLEFDDGSARYDLHFAFVEHDASLAVRLQYDGSLFDAATAGRMLDRLEELLVSACAAPDARISTLRAMPDTERHLLLDDWSGIARTRPVTRTMMEIFSAQARARPDAIAVVCGPRRVTYAELDVWSTRLAHRLRAMGVCDDVVVGIAIGRTPALFAAQLAVLKAGGAYMPVDTRQPASRLDFMLRDAAVTLVLAVDETPPVLAGLGPRVLTLDSVGRDLDGLPDDALASGATPESLAYVMYTSGSTGMPKGVAVMQRGVVRVVCDTDYARFGPDERFLQQGSIAFDVTVFESWGALLNGGCVVQVPGDAPSLQEMARVIRDERVTTAWFTAGLFNSMVDHVLDCFDGVAQVLAGGEVLSVTHAKRFVAAHPRTRLINAYGPTEATTFATAYTVDDPAELDPSVPIGRPIANATAYVLDADLRLVPIGVVGELHLGGAGIARGYLGRPELTAERFVANPFHAGDRLYRTGDLVRWRSDGTLQFVGRADRQLKLRGFRIEPLEIESALQAHPAIAQAVVVPRGEPGGEPRLVAFCVIAPGASAPDIDALRAFVTTRLPHYMVPAVITLLPRMPLTPQGKIDLKALSAVDMATRPAPHYVAPRTPFEDELATIWQEVLRLERVGVTDDFFVLGGHSLLAVRMLFRVWDVFAVELPLASVFHHPTIEQLALRILERMAASDAAASPAP